VLYNYIVYVFAMPLNVAFLLHLTLVTLSVYTAIGLAGSMDGQAVRQRLSGAVPERLAGGVLVGLGLLFLLLQPLLTPVPFAPVDVMVVFAMGLICFIPFALFTHGILANRDPSSAATATTSGQKSG